MFGKQFAIDFTLIEIGKAYDLEVFQVYLADTLYYMSRQQALRIKYSDLLPKETTISRKSGDEIVAKFLENWNGGIE